MRLNWLGLCFQQNIFAELFDQLDQYCSQHKIHHHRTTSKPKEETEPTDENAASSSPTHEAPNVQQEVNETGKILNSDMSLKQFLKYVTSWNASNSYGDRWKADTILSVLEIPRWVGWAQYAYWGDSWACSVGDKLQEATRDDSEILC